jgi:TRAP transporter TAXI family solute receptor
MIRSEHIRKYSAWIIPVLAFTLVATWMLTRDTLPGTIRLASAKEGGLYYRFAMEFAPMLQTRSGKKVEVLKTNGTIENMALLKSGDAHIALLQSSAVESQGLSAIAPLYNDVVHVVVRKQSGINAMGDLAGHGVSLGPRGSGMRRTAELILAHYQLKPEDMTQTENYFMAMHSNTNIDAAIITTGVTNPDLGNLLLNGQFELLPIYDARALHTKHPFFTPSDIPRGMYAPGVPSQPIPTVACMAFMAVKADASPLLVTAALDALYEDYQPAGYPPTIPLNKVEDSFSIPLHPAALSYRDPHRGLELFGRFVEWLAALKELLFALAAGVYLLWSRWRKLKQKEEAEAYAQQRKALDALMDETIKIERDHMNTTDPDILRKYLDEVTHIKLRALDQLTDNRLRGDRQFSIFLMQCSNLIRKMQEKCIFHLSENKNNER